MSNTNQAEKLFKSIKSPKDIVVAILKDSYSISNDSTSETKMIFMRDHTQTAQRILEGLGIKK